MHHCACSPQRHECVCANARRHMCTPSVAAELVSGSEVGVWCAVCLALCRRCSSRPTLPALRIPGHGRAFGGALGCILLLRGSEPVWFWISRRILWPSQQTLPPTVLSDGGDSVPRFKLELPANFVSLGHYPSEKKTLLLIGCHALLA